MRCSYAKSTSFSACFSPIIKGSRAFPERECALARAVAPAQALHFFQLQKADLSTEMDARLKIGGGKITYPTLILGESLQRLRSAPPAPSDSRASLQY